MTNDNVASLTEVNSACQLQSLCASTSDGTANEGISNDSKSLAMQWASSLAQESLTTKCMVVGLMSGSRHGNDRRSIDGLARSMSNALTEYNPRAQQLLIRLDVFPSTSVERQVDQPEGIPKAEKSALGKWHQMQIPMPIGRQASWSLLQLPRWLPKLKNEFGMIMIDLGPMHHVPSRTIGRLCDHCYVLLGPDLCASVDWIRQHLAWHDRAGSTVGGTIIITSNAA